MAAFDYSELVSAADELIQEFGRQVSFLKYSSTPADAAKPWRGENVSLDSRLDNIWAAIVPWMSKDDKDSVRYSVKIVIVSASQFPSNDGEIYDTVIDSDGSVLHLHDAQIINPGPTRVLYTFRAEQ